MTHTMKLKIYKRLLKILPLFLLLFSITLYSQEAKKATGGTGIYKDRIWWLNFEGISLASGAAQTRTFTVGSATVTVIIDQIAFSGSTSNGLRLDGYNSSYNLGSGFYNYHGDGLDEMYNIGGKNGNNQLYYALTNNNNGNANSTGVGLKTTFRMRAYVANLDTPLSLIFASAEADESFFVGSGYEYTKSTTNGSTWQLLEKKVQSTDVEALQRLKFSNGNLTAEMSMGAYFSPANVALLYTTKTSASLVAPLVVNTEMMSGGKSAIAIGLIIDQDGGDAPSTFGSAIHSFQPLLTGGNPIQSTHYLNNAPILNTGVLTVPNTLYLGNTPPDNDASVFTSANSDADDLNGSDDEDAFTTNPVILAACESSYSITVPLHNTTSATAYLRGWIDFNGDGTFQSSESTSISVPNNATSATLSWTGLTPITTTVFRAMRLRISNNNLSAVESATTVLSGEVEDHRIQFLAVEAPTIGSITHATCSTATGSFAISNYNSAYSYTFSPSSGISINTTTGLVTANPGTYTITVKNGNCNATVNVQINNTSTVAAGIASTNQSIACGKPPTVLSLAGAVGTIQWQVSTDNISFINIPAANNTYYAPGNLIQTTYYRAKVTSGACSENSNTIIITVAACQVPFACNTGYYLTQHPSSGNVTTLYSLNNTTNPFTITQIGTPTPYDVNAIGYNTVDNFIYGMRTDTGFTNHIVKIDSNGVMVSSLVTGLPTGGYNSGGFDNNGNYFILSYGASVMRKINVTNSTFVNITLSRALSLNDITYDTINNLFYGFDGVNRVLVSISPTSGTVTNIGVSNTILSATELIGAMYSDLNGNIYGNSDDGSGFYQFNKITGASTKISSSIAAFGNDGANCPSAIIYPSDLSVTKTDGETTYTPGTEITYTIVVKNHSPFGVVNVRVVDNVPAGVPATNVTYTAIASIGSTTNVTSIQTGAINDLVSLPVDGTVTYTVKLNIPITFAGNLVNTVTVTPPTNSTDSNMANNTATDTNLNERCYKPAATGTTTETKHGITSLGRAGAENGNWPMVRNNAWTVLESKTKGFVINRIPTTVAVNALPNPVIGMIIYDEEADCLKINIDGTSAGWKCFNTQTCPTWSAPIENNRL